MSRYAIVENGVVVNVVIWDGKTECAAIPDDAICLPSNSPVGPGFTFDGTAFAAPAPAPSIPSL